MMMARCSSGNRSALRVCSFSLQLLLVLPLFAGGASAWNFWPFSTPESQVQELTDETFDTFMLNNPTSAVLFYAPWCGFSKMVSPQWETAATKLAAHDPPIRLARIDASKYRTVGERYFVDAYPQLKMFLDDTIVDFPPYTPRNWGAVVNWVNSHTQRNHVISTVTEFETFTKDTEYVVVALFPDGHSATDREIYRQSTRHSGDIVFIEADGKNAAVIADHLRRKLDFHELDHFIRGYRNPVINVLTPQNAPHIFTHQLPVLVVAVDRLNPQKSSEASNAVTSAAKELRGKMVVCITGTEDNFEKRLTGLLGIDGGATDLPAARIVLPGPDGNLMHKGTKKYKLEDTYKQFKPTDENYYLHFVARYFSKQLKPYIRSEAIPNTPYHVPGRVQTLVGDTFSDQVLRKLDTDHLVAFIAPWCGHCRKLDEPYTKLAAQLKHVKTMVVAKIDATRNETPDFPVNAYPTILLLRAGKPNIKHQALEYQGPRVVDGFVRFLLKECTHKFDPSPPPQPIGGKKKKTRSVLVNGRWQEEEVEEL